MEVCALRDVAPDFEKSAVKVYGISFDDVATQAKFHEKEKLNFDLLSDPDGSVATKYGTAMGNRPFARRWTFLIDRDGVLRFIDKKVNVRDHGNAVLAKIAELEKESVKEARK